MSKLEDSGHRQQFASGGQRERAAGKGRYDLIPPEAVDALAKVLEAGAAKYGDRNWEKGLPLGTFLDSGLRHFFKLMAGVEDGEDHAAMAMTNLAMFISTRERGIDGLSVTAGQAWREGDKANVDELAERQKWLDAAAKRALYQPTDDGRDSSRVFSGWLSANRCQPENPFPHEAHGYDRASSGAVLMIDNGAHWCDGFVDPGHKAQQARDIETVKGVADKLTRTAVKPRPIRDAPQA